MILHRCDLCGVVEIPEGIQSGELPTGWVLSTRDGAPLHTCESCSRPSQINHCRLPAPVGIYWLEEGS